MGRVSYANPPQFLAGRSATEIPDQAKIAARSASGVVMGIRL
jgi:hypothetical protein